MKTGRYYFPSFALPLVPRFIVIVSLMYVAVAPSAETATLTRLMANSSQPDATARKEVSFIACPVYRDVDAGPKSGCWLATERTSGLHYDVSAAPSKPLLGKTILVEGVEQLGDEHFCGGTVLQPVRVSVLNESCPEHILPAEEFSGRVFALPASVMQPTDAPRQLPTPLFSDQKFSILFHFQSDFLNYQYSEVLLEKIALVIKASQPKRVRVVGYSATEPYKVSGQTLRETKPLASARADIVILALTRLGINESLIKKEINHKPHPIDHYANGLAEETKRRVDILMEL